MTPRAIPAIRVTGKLVMPAITPQNRPRNSNPGPRNWPPENPLVGRTSMAVNAAMTPPRAHASDDRRGARMPAMSAASWLEAAARMAIPSRPRRRKIATASTNGGVRISMAV